ncbi:hypothetical protein TNCV_3467561 [Trichonephila clavipes]|nr:hypothetical protein TNCV_3467561 [Trichonephila clavipes]
MTLIDANAVASRRLINNNFKYTIPALNSNRTIASIITRLRTKRVKGMKISTDGQRSYTNHCPNYLNIQQSPQHILSCSAIQERERARLFKISPEDLIFSDKAVEERSKASFFINLYIMDTPTKTIHLRSPKPVDMVMNL